MLGMMQEASRVSQNNRLTATDIIGKGRTSPNDIQCTCSKNQNSSLGDGLELSRMMMKPWALPHRLRWPLTVWVQLKVLVHLPGGWAMEQFIQWKAM